MRIRKPGSVLSLLLAAMLVLTWARPVLAEEVATEQPSLDVLDVTASTLRHAAILPELASSSSSAYSSSFLATPKEIRLSSGAKTAIIITAIIVGALIIVGVVVIGKPHKHL